MSFVADFSDRANELPGHVWHWFNTLNREEWLVTLTVVCVLGFLCLTGMRSKRL